MVVHASCQNKNGSLKLKCITGQCHVCTFSPMYDLPSFKGQGVVKFHQFIVEEHTYISKKGEMKSGKQTIRKDFNERIQKYITKFDSRCLLIFCINLKLRKNDLFHWPQILSDTDLGYLFHQDYSENSCTPKYEPQDTHFSSKQTSLHCTVVYGCKEKPKYDYHISENKGHDSAFTLLVTKDLMEFPFSTSKVTTAMCSIVVCMSLKPT